MNGVPLGSSVAHLLRSCRALVPIPLALTLLAPFKPDDFAGMLHDDLARKRKG